MDINNLLRLFVANHLFLHECHVVILELPQISHKPFLTNSGKYLSACVRL